MLVSCQWPCETHEKSRARGNGSLSLGAWTHTLESAKHTWKIPVLNGGFVASEIFDFHGVNRKINENHLFHPISIVHVPARNV